MRLVSSALRLVSSLAPRSRPTRKSPSLLRLARLEDRTVPAWAGTVTGNAISWLGDAANDSVQLSVVAGNLQHSVVGSGFASNQDFDNATPGVQSVAIADLTSLAINGGGGTDAVTFNGATFHNYSVATLVDIDVEGVTIAQDLAIGAGGFTSDGAGIFNMSVAGKSLAASGSVAINHGSTINLRGPVSGSSVSLTSASTSGNAIYAVTSASTVTATTGDVSLSAAGGINFSAGTLVTNVGDVNLNSTGTGAINVFVVNSASDLSSTSGGLFNADTGSVLTVNGATTINHTGVVNFRGTISSGSFDATSASISSNAFNAVTSAVTITTTTGDLNLTASAGGINFNVGTLVSDTGNIVLQAPASSAVSVLGVESAGDFTATGGGNWSTNTGSIIDVDGDFVVNHTGTINLRGPIDANSIALTSGSASVNSIYAVTSSVALTAGSIEFNTSGGGVNFGLGSMTTTAGDIDITAGRLIDLFNVISAGKLTTTGGNGFDTSTGGAISVAGDIDLNHTGTIVFRQPITGKSISMTTTSASAAAINGFNTAATLTSTAGNVTLDAAGGVTLTGVVSVTGPPSVGTPVNLKWSDDTANLAAGELDMSDMVVGVTKTFTNPGGGGFDVAVKYSGSFQGGYAGSVPVLGSDNYIWYQSSNSTGGLAWFEIWFYETGTSTPVDVTGLKAVFEDVERGGSTREWLLGPKIVTAGVPTDLDFSNTSIFTVPESTWGKIIDSKLVDGVPVSRAVPGHSILGGTQDGKEVEVDLMTTPLSYFRMGQQRTLSSAGSVLLGSLGTLQITGGGAPVGEFSSKGTTFSARNITVGETGKLTLEHNGTRTVNGAWDAGTYTITGTGNTNVALIGGLTFYMNVETPPATPLLTQATGNLAFAAGSTVNIVAAGNPAFALLGSYNLATVGGTVSGSFTTNKTGTGATALTNPYALGNSFKIDVI